VNLWVRTICCFVSDMRLMSRMLFLTCICCIWMYLQCNRGIILLTISIILKVQVLWHVAEYHGFTNHLVTKFCMVMPDICELSALNRLHVALLAPRILRWLIDLDFCKSCTSPCYTEWQLATSSNGITSQKTCIFISSAVRTANLVLYRFIKSSMIWRVHTGLLT